MPSRILIVGLGLIGGSLARALRRQGYFVIGVDSRRGVLRAALGAKALDLAPRRLEEAVQQADLVVLAAPPRANRGLLSRVARSARPGLVVTDVSSVKGAICKQAAALGLDFVGGHPMAGRQRSGFAASDADLFRGRPWILTQPASRRALALARRLARAAGARPVVLSVAEHDRAVAFLSHLPQLLSWALVESVRHDPVAARHARLAGPAFADMTRIANSPRQLWRQILEENNPEVERALRAFRRRLAKHL